MIINPADRRVELLDLERRVQAEISFTKLDEKQTTLHRAIADAIRKQEDAGGRSNRLSAEMSRALNDPALTQTFDPATSHLQLTNSAVTVDATGATEPDTRRLTLIVTALDALIKLTAVRDPESIPPFIRLDTVHALIADHHLRPTELAFTYRLAGPPRKHRWTYRLVDTLTSRELEALNRVARLRTNTPFIPFERYERRPAETKAKSNLASPPDVQCADPRLGKSTHRTQFNRETELSKNDMTEKSGPGAQGSVNDSLPPAE